MNLNRIKYIGVIAMLAFLTACGGGGGSPGTSSGGSAVSTPLFTSAPGALTLSSGTTSPSYSISGGVAPYTANSDNPLLLSVSLNAAEFKVAAAAGNSGSGTVVITDAKGTKLTVTATVPAPAALFSTAPATLQILSGTTNFYTLFGGVAPYVVNTNGVIAKAVLSGTSLVISGVVVGHQTVAVSDAKGSMISIDVTVNQGLYTDAPANLIIASGTGATYAIYGGVPYGGAALYRVNVSNSVIASATVTGSILSISGLSGGSTTMVISDSVGGSSLISVTVPVAGALMSTAPSSLRLAIGNRGVYAISGGGGTYTATSSNPVLVSASVSGGSILTIAAAADTLGGAANVIITDSVGTSPLTISVAVVPVQFFTTAPSSLVIAGSDPKIFSVFGGSLPYSVVNTNPAVVVGVISSAATPTTLTIRGAIPGAGTVILSDAKGATVSIDVTVSASTALFSNAPGGSLITTLIAGASYQYLVYGGSNFDPGVPGSYSAASTNPGVVSASLAGPVLTVTALANGSSTVRVTDAIGTQLDIGFVVGSGSSTNTNYPALTPVLQTGGGVATSSIDATGYTLLKVTMKDPSGVGIPNQVISVTGDLTKLSFPEGNAALTSASGLATIKVARASLLATGAGAMTVTYDYKPGMITSYSGNVTPPSVAQLITTYVGYQVTTANISLTNLDVGTPATMKAYGTQQVSVIANVNGVPATSTPVTVSFSATCGQVLPATASTDSAGKVLVTYSATDATGTLPSTLGCSGKTVQITASTSGATAVTQNIAVSAAPATSISFVSAAPSRIYLANACGVNPSCLTQSILTFQLLNQSGEGIAGQSVRLTLKSLNGGTPKASFDTVGGVTPVTLTTDSTGKVSQPVYSGAVPTNVIVNASLVATPTIQTDSSILAIASGRPVQARLSLAFEKLSIEGLNMINSAGVTVYLADRQGNPVPDGTVVNFVTEGGVMIPPTCITGIDPGDSRCSVTIRSGNPRTANGLVTILAYVAGEEDFVDSGNGVPGTAGNNVYDCGEPFTDLGIAYRDDAMTSSVLNAYAAGEFTVPRAALTSACVAGVERTVGEGVPGTHDAVWGAVDVRTQGAIVFASTSAVTSNAAAITKDSLTFTVADVNGNSMPTGTNIVVASGDNTPTNSKSCRIFSGSSTVVPNTLTPLTLFASFLDCEANDRITVKVTSPLGTVTESTYTIP